jgi:hypothetical protein
MIKLSNDEDVFHHHGASADDRHPNKKIGLMVTIDIDLY